MSKLREVLTVPDAIIIPDELDRAWQWMEDQGWGVQNANGYFLTPYAGDSQLGIVFSDTATLEGWFEPDSEAAAQLLPFAEIAGDGSVGACGWQTGRSASSDSVPKGPASSLQTPRSISCAWSPSAMAK